MYVWKKYLDVNHDRFLREEWALELTLGQTTELARNGISIPIAQTLKTQLNAKVLLLGFGLPDDNLHGPNEKLDLANFYRGIETIPWFRKYFANIHAFGE